MNASDIISIIAVLISVASVAYTNATYVQAEQHRKQALLEADLDACELLVTSLRDYLRQVIDASVTRRSLEHDSVQLQFLKEQLPRLPVWLPLRGGKLGEEAIQVFRVIESPKVQLSILIDRTIGQANPKLMLEAMEGYQSDLKIANDAVTNLGLLVVKEREALRK